MKPLFWVSQNTLDWGHVAYCHILSCLYSLSTLKHILKGRKVISSTEKTKTKNKQQSIWNQYDTCSRHLWVIVQFLLIYEIDYYHPK
jgi:hypothetical protein